MQSSFWNPRQELADLERRFSPFFNTALRLHPSIRQSGTSWTPAVDVSESADAFLFTVELPGMKPEDVNIEVKENVLTITGERAGLESKDGVHVHHRERPTGRFARAFRLHKPVDAEQVTATYRHGVLDVTVPLRVEAKPRKITVLGS
ncbi:MAG: Hsp20/alpha crystallin family protein [Deltaproteobacteria bacterium]|nr:Hsp20/alpha crystallin family protein [Deltaproteobacteria bacterium]